MLNTGQSAVGYEAIAKLTNNSFKATLNVLYWDKSDVNTEENTLNCPKYWIWSPVNQS